MWLYMTSNNTCKVMKNCSFSFQVWICLGLTSVLCSDVTYPVDSLRTVPISLILIQIVSLVWSCLYSKRPCVILALSIF